MSIERKYVEVITVVKNQEEEPAQVETKYWEYPYDDDDDDDDEFYDKEKMGGIIFRLGLLFAGLFLFVTSSLIKYTTE